MSSESHLLRVLVVMEPFLIASPGFAGIKVNPGGIVKSLVADPVRSVFYASIEVEASDDKIVVVDAVTATITDQVLVPDVPKELAVAQDGSKLYVALDSTDEVAEYDLPGLTFSRNFTLSDVFGFYRGMVAKPRRLCVARDDSLSVMASLCTWVMRTRSMRQSEPRSGCRSTWVRCRAMWYPGDGSGLQSTDTGCGDRVPGFRRGTYRANRRVGAGTEPWRDPPAALGRCRRGAYLRCPD